MFDESFKIYEGSFFHMETYFFIKFGNVTS